jgi:hypothetical protein
MGWDGVGSEGMGWGGVQWDVFQLPRSGFGRAVLSMRCSGGPFLIGLNRQRSTDRPIIGTRYNRD